MFLCGLTEGTKGYLYLLAQRGKYIFVSQEIKNR